MKKLTKNVLKNTPDLCIDVTNNTDKRTGKVLKTSPLPSKWSGTVLDLVKHYPKPDSFFATVLPGYLTSHEKRRLGARFVIELDLDPVLVSAAHKVLDGTSLSKKEKLSITKVSNEKKTTTVRNASRILNNHMAETGYHLLLERMLVGGEVSHDRLVEIMDEVLLKGDIDEP